MHQDFVFKIEDKEYPVLVTEKRIRYIHYRFRDGSFLISTPRYVSRKKLIEGLNKYGKSLIEKSTEFEPPIDDNYVYFLGNKYFFDERKEVVINDALSIKFKDQFSLEKELRKIFLKLCIERVKYYTEIMNIPLYDIKVRKMKSRYGSNSVTSRTICFATKLIHYSLEIIDSVVVHELAHVVVFNHSKKFYDLVYKYCPNYKQLHLKLKKGLYQ